MSFDQLIDNVSKTKLWRQIKSFPQNDNKWNINIPQTSLRSILYYLIQKQISSKLLIVVPDIKRAKQIKADLISLNKQEKIEIYPSLDVFSNQEYIDYTNVGERLKVLRNMQMEESMLVIAPIKALMFKAINPQELEKNIMILSLKQNNITPQKITSLLVANGYVSSPIVGQKGEFCVKGGLVDVFPTNQTNAIRIEFVDDSIESIRCFDTHTQRSINNIEHVEIFPAKDTFSSSIVTNLAKETRIIVEDPLQIQYIADQFDDEIKRFKQIILPIITLNDINQQIDKYKQIEVSSVSKNINTLMLNTSMPKKFNKNIDELNNYINQKNTEIYIVSRHLQRLREYFRTNGLDLPRAKLIEGQLSSGFLVENDKIELFTDKEIFGEQSYQQKDRDWFKEGVNQNLLVEFKTGDYVVHENYGIAMFKGMEKLKVDETIYEFMQLVFAGDEKLYVPLSQMGIVKKYSSNSEYHPKLSRLSSPEWKKIKQKVKKRVKDITKELVQLYAYRSRLEGYAFKKEEVYQRELQSTFYYEETADQIQSIKEIYADMENQQPMDRLLCGDVGYGKTEVALRAAVKAAANGKQVAMLVPTTILAHQHFTNFAERLRSLPFKVEVLSRFRSRLEQKEIIEKMALGQIDIVIGTHRLLQKDIKFNDLGLLIIDEEHRFGVSHKEKLKNIKKTIDVLSLSATPIPRTLYFSISGIREISVINTPPIDRLPVRTYVFEYSQAMVQEAIRREIERGGQVFFLHNFVETIKDSAHQIKQLVPEAKIAVAHGQMNERELEQTMVDFMERKYDVLICTTIIESGLDIPNANTIIIDHAHRFGLAELYQLRGRVGRASSRAYAYLLYHPKELKSKDAIKRLSAIQEFTKLGSGYQLAIRDLEIRGTGNLLGAEQHGHMLAVGFDLYCSLLDEAVKEIKGDTQLPARQILIDLQIDAYIPDDYIDDERQRIAIYRRMGTIENLNELKEMRAELVDRFGYIPNPINKLIQLVALKLEARKNGIDSIIRQKNSITLKYYENKKLESLIGSLKSNFTEEQISFRRDRIILSIKKQDIDDWLMGLMKSLKVKSA